MFDGLLEVERLLDDAIAHDDPSVLTASEFCRTAALAASIQGSALAMLARCRAMLLQFGSLRDGHGHAVVAVLSDPPC